MLDLEIEDLSSDPQSDGSCDKEKVETLRQKILGDKTLVSRIDEPFLLSFLRARNFDEDDAFKCIKKYYEVKKKFPVVFKNFLPSAVQQILDQNCLGYLKTTDGSGRVIIIGIASRWISSVSTIWEGFRAFLLIIEALLSYDLVQRNGVVIIVDFRGLSWKTILQFTPNFVYTAHHCMVESYPVRYQQIHFIAKRKIPWISSTLLRFCPQELRERLFIHASDFESLCEAIEPKYLPRDFGGELPLFDASHSNGKLREGEEYFKYCESHWNQDKPE